jgi:hypothetical protein
MLARSKSLPASNVTNSSDPCVLPTKKPSGGQRRKDKKRSNPAAVLVPLMLCGLAAGGYYLYRRFPHVFGGGRRSHVQYSSVSDRDVTGPVHLT